MIETLIATNSGQKCFQSNQTNHLCQKTIHLDVYFKNLDDYTTWLNWLQLLIDMVVWNGWGDWN